MPKVPQLLLLSNSTNHGTGYLEWAEEHIKSALLRNQANQVLFVPYAAKDQSAYTTKFRSKMEELGYSVLGVNEVEDPVKAVMSAEAIFIGGGNTFLLLKTLYEKNLIDHLRKRVLKDGVLYMGASAGTNVATTSICTSNDMPIVYPPSFVALQLVPFNINPHYLDTDISSTHMGETREKRIEEYHELPDTPTVVGLREGSLLKVNGDFMTLEGFHGARVFRRNEPPIEFDVGSDLSILLRE